MAVDGNGVVFAGTFGGGVFAAQTPPNWFRVTNGLTERYLPTLTTGPDGAIYARGPAGTVLKSDPGTFAWSTVSPVNPPPNYGGGSFSLAVDGAGDVYIGANNGVFKYSIDDAAWTQLTTVGLPPSDTFVARVAVDAAGNVLAQTQGGVFRLPSGAASWTATSLPASAVQYTSKLLFDATGTAWIGITGLGVAYLLPGSTTWTALNDGLDDLRVTDLAFDAAGRLYAGTNSNGVWSATPFVSDWSQLVTTGLPSPNVQSVAVDGVGRVYAGSGCGVYVLGPGTVSWSPTYGALNTDVWSMVRYPTGVFYGFSGCGPAKRSPGGTWGPLTTNGLADDPAFIFGFTVDVSAGPNTGTVYAGSVVVSKLPPGANAWTSTTGLALYTNVLTTDEAGNVYAGTTNDGVFVLSSGATAWSQLTLAGLLNHQVSSLVVRTTGGVVAATPDGVFTLSVGAISWQFTTGLPNTGYPLVRDAADNVYVPTGGAGIFKLANGSSAWTVLPTAGLPSAARVTVGPDGTLYAGANAVYALAPGASNWRLLGAPDVPGGASIGAMVVDPVTQILHVSVPLYGMYELHPQCFDSVIDIGEECDSGAEPTGCQETASCVACECVTTTTTSSTSTTEISSTTSTSLVTTTSTQPTTTSTQLSTTTSLAPTISSSSTSSPSTTSTAPPGSSSSTSTTSTAAPSSSSTTSTTSPAVCGDGKQDPNEACDGSAPGQSLKCCLDCRIVRTGTTCETADTFGLCHEGSTCDGAARCVAKAKPVNEPCRAAGAQGGCDIGDACDGTSLECPRQGEELGCGIDVTKAKPEAKKARVDCTAQSLGGVAIDATACEAGGDVETESAPVGVGAAAARRSVSVIDVVSKPLKKAKRGKGKRTLKLRLNQQGRDFLKGSTTGSLTVRVTATIRVGNGSRSANKFLEFRRR